MKELVGRLTELDPQASETLKIVTYFDALVDGRPTTDALLRGAAALAGAPVGMSRSDGGTTRWSAAGVRLEPGGPDGWVVRDVDDTSQVWLERGGPGHVNDAMVVERLAIAVSITRARVDTQAPVRRAVELLVDETATTDERLAAAGRLGLDAHAAVRAVALPARVGHGPAAAHHATVATPWGIVHVVVEPASATTTRTRAGVGTVATPLTLAGSWRAALVALRLTDDERPVVRADELGALLVLAEAVDGLPEVPSDVAALAGTGWSTTALQALADGGSMRAVAAAAGVHHSTIQARLARLTDHLGYDPLTALGRTRLYTALLLHRLTTDRPG